MITYAVLVPVAVLCLRDPVGRRVISLAAPAAAVHWLLYLAGAGPFALEDAETGISAAAVQHIGAHIALMRNLVTALYLTLAVAVCALAAASSRIRKGTSSLSATR